MRVFLLFVIILITPYLLEARVKVNITGGKFQSIPIAIQGLNGNNGMARLIGRDVIKVINKDLESSQIFDVIKSNEFSGFDNNSKNIPNFGLWKSINANIMVNGSISLEKNNISVDVRVWDIYSEKEILQKSYTTHRDHWRRISHLIADQIYSYVSGEAGYFDTRIVYVSEYGNFQNRVKRLAIMDQDGANHQYISNGKYLVLTPRFSRNRQKIIYLSYKNDKPKVYLYDLEKEQQRLVGAFNGMSFAPRFSPVDENVILSSTEAGNSEIYEVNLDTNNKRRLTFNSSIDTSPDYSPDGNKIVFNSNRAGSPQLYIMDRDGGNVKRISFGQGQYTSPVWSPRGDLIAFTKQHKGKFHIGIIGVDGKHEKLLTTSFLDESPTWSPNGRVILFTRQAPYRNKNNDGVSSIYSIDITGENLKKLPTPRDASDPAWSPLLQTQKVN